MKQYCKIFSLVMCAVMLFSFFCGCKDNRESLERILQNDVIVFGVEPDAIPFAQVKAGTESRSGEYSQDAVSGISAEIGAALADALNVEAVYITVEPEDALEALNKGTIDCYLCLVCPDIKTEAQMRTIDTGLDYRCVVVSKGEETIDSLLDIKNKRVAVVSGSDAEAYFENAEVMYSECAEIIRSSDLNSLITELSNVDAAIVEEMLFLYRTQGANGYNILDNAVYQSDYLLCVRLRDEALANRLSEIYSGLESDGTIDYIKKKWLGSGAE